jgi:hypothetical protein
MTAQDDRPKRNGAEPGPVLIGGNKLATHFGISRQHVERLTGEGVIERRADGLFDQDVSRLKYMTHLRSEHRKSPRAAADAEQASAKAALLRIRIEEKQRKLVRRKDVNELIDAMAGTVLTHLSGMAARCSRDLAVRRNIDAVVMQVRRELSEACSKMADANGEPVDDVS